MSAKELVEAATRMKKRGVGGFTSLDDIDLATDYILATVRPDDDEPVTRERLETDGWFRRSIRHRHRDTQFTVIEINQRFVAETEIEKPLCNLKSIGHLRRLVAALGE